MIDDEIVLLDILDTAGEEEFQYVQSIRLQARQGTDISSFIGLCGKRT